MSEKLLLIDGHSILNRAFYGLPDLTNSEGLHTNAVYGFLTIIFKIIEEEKPNYVTVAFDLKAPTFRHKMFEEYKGTRKGMPEELRMQVPLMKEMLDAMGIKRIEMEGYEADDLLGTLSVRGEQEGMEVRVLSGDRDLLQLATQKVQIRIPKTKKTGTEIENYFESDIIEKMGVTPKEFIDVKALMGDTADNIPGVPGIGEKTAYALISQYGSIEAVHENAAEIKPPRASKNIVEFWEQAVLSKELATICVSAPLSYDFNEAKFESLNDFYTPEAYEMCKRLEFKNLLGRFDVKASAPKVECDFISVDSEEMAKSIWEKTAQKEIGIAATSECYAIALSEKEVYSIPEICCPLATAISECHAASISCMDVKKLLRSHGLEAWGDERRALFFDNGIAAYLVNPLIGNYPYEDVAKSSGLFYPSQADICGKKPGEAEIREYLSYEALTACVTKKDLLLKLKELEMLSLYEEIEHPLLFVLANMEKEGVLADKEALRIYGEELSTSIEALEQRIYEAAGEEFNINSPKQLGVILFEKLELPGAKKTKTGYSTSVDVLEKLKHEYPIVKDILEYRQLAKLKSTYADGLMQVILADGKIHTTFNQTVTSTGRLSSTEPNLQNIPIRIELGKQIRKVFHPKDGYVFLDSDYSQIELRVLAHMSGDEKLIDAFQKKQDIHARTASEVFHVPFEEVTALQRRNAKAVNFGIVYGISAFGLSQDLDISKKEAAEYIDGYFATYPKIKGFLDQMVEEAKETGVSKTIYHRIRPIPELKSSNFMQRSFGERIAMNAPIQGTAADIIKIAMIRVYDRLKAENLDAKLLLQVHDELLIEVKEENQDKVRCILEEEMKAAVSLSVDMEVETASGKNWYEAH